MTIKRQLSVGVMLTPLGPDAALRDYLELARYAEELGYDAIFQGDHLFGNTATPDCLTMLGAFAAVTERVELGTSVALVPLREPVVMAKQVATVDQLSGGRLIFGVGVGGEIPREFAAMDVPLAGRGRRTDEYLDLMKQLWSGDPVEHDGRYRRVSGVAGSPLPARAGGPPVWVGGRSDAAIARAMRFDGWCSYASSAETVGAGAERIRARRPDLHISASLFTHVAPTRQQAVAEAADVVRSLMRQDWTRRFDRLALVGTQPDVARRLREYADAGIDRLIVIPTVSSRAALRQQLELVREATCHAG